MFALNMYLLEEVRTYLKKNQRKGQWVTRTNEYEYSLRIRYPKTNRRKRQHGSYKLYKQTNEY